MGLNGCVALSPPSIMLAADTFGGAIWRVDFSADGSVEQTKLWLKDESMAQLPDTLPPPPQPGINGLRYSPRTNHIYYTTTGQKLFMRVEIDPIGFEPAGSRERLCGGGMYDDFCIDEPRGVAYLTVHRENRIDCAPLAPGGPGLHALVGDPLIGYDAARALQRRLEPRAGRIWVLFVTSDGGHTAPPPGGALSAKVLRLELA